MRITDALEALQVTMLPQEGHSTAAVEGVRNSSGALLVVADRNTQATLERRFPGLSCIVLSPSMGGRLAGRGGALVLDNSAVALLAGRALSHIRKLESQIRELRCQKDL